MLSRKNKLLLLKLLSLFSIVRGYNVLVIILAQYLAAIYIMAPDLPLRRVVFDLSLFVIVLASALINKPRKSMLDRLVSQQTKLTTYFLLNFLAVFFASYVSFRAVLFFAAYIFGIWLYSHKLKRIPFLGNLVSSTLAITPFFAVFVYYRNFETVIFVHAMFLFLLILSREMVKDMENIAGDIALNYKTIPILFGTRYSKIIVSLLVFLALLPAYLLIEIFDVGYMYLYFILVIFLLLGFVILMWRAKSKKHYVWLHNILKFIIVAGVFSILLINVDLVLNRII